MAYHSNINYSVPVLEVCTAPSPPLNTHTHLHTHTHTHTHTNTHKSWLRACFVKYNERVNSALTGKGSPVMMVFRFFIGLFSVLFFSPISCYKQNEIAIKHQKQDVFNKKWNVIFQEPHSHLITQSLYMCIVQITTIMLNTG